MFMLGDREGYRSAGIEWRRGGLDEHVGRFIHVSRSGVVFTNITIFIG